MDWIFERTTDFFTNNLPSLQALVIGCPLSLAWVYAGLHTAGYLKTKKGLKTGYTRKIFHFWVFTSVALIQFIWDTPVVCLFGGMASLVIFYALLRGSGTPLYEAMAREKDAPHQTLYIVVPFIATLMGGLVSNILFGPVAVVGYLVTGFGDAVGEPVGTRFGKHTYRAPSLTSVKATRSWEGSAAVFLMSVVAIVVAVPLSGELGFTAWSLLTIPLVGLFSAAAEAVSPHGWDNLTMQIVPNVLALWLI